MDGNRTHPGRLSSAPPTVLKTATLASGIVNQRKQFLAAHAESLVAADFFSVDTRIDPA